VIVALSPENWTPRTQFGWQFDHLLEGLQAFTPDRTANFVAALCGAGGVLAAALVAELFIRTWKRFSKRSAK
jgi:hypothetical protein